MTLNEANINEYPWLLFKIAGITYAVSSKEITAITDLPKHVTIIPDKAYYIRGLMEFRGGHIRLIDMRALLNLNSKQDECDAFLAMIEERKQDHVNWVIELEKSVRDDSEFALASDPTKCKLWHWYADFVAPSTLIGANLRQFIDPHKNLHGLAAEINQMRAQYSDPQECLIACEGIFSRAHSYKNKILDILSSTQKIYNDEIREMVIAFEDNDNFFGVIVDEVLSVDEINLLGGNNANNSVFRSHYINGIGRTSKSKELVLLLDYTKLLENEWE